MPEDVCRVIGSEEVIAATESLRRIVGLGAKAVEEGLKLNPQ